MEFLKNFEFFEKFWDFCGGGDVEGGWWWRCQFRRGVGVGVGHGEMGVMDVVVVGVGAGGRVSWGVSVEVGIGGGRCGVCV